MPSVASFARPSMHGNRGSATHLAFFAREPWQCHASRSCGAHVVWELWHCGAFRACGGTTEHAYLYNEKTCVHNCFERRQPPMVSRIYVEKKPGFDVEAQQLTAELRSILQLEALKNVRLINRYDVEGIGDRAVRALRPHRLPSRNPTSPTPSCPKPTAPPSSQSSTCPDNSTSVPTRRASASSSSARASAPTSCSAKVYLPRRRPHRCAGRGQ